MMFLAARSLMSPVKRCLGCLADNRGFFLVLILGLLKPFFPVVFFGAKLSLYLHGMEVTIFVKI